jgi:hypothetical protein
MTWSSALSYEADAEIVTALSARYRPPWSHLSGVSFKLQEIPEQVLHKIPATFQAVPALNSRDDRVEEFTALENTFSWTMAL